MAVTTPACQTATAVNGQTPCPPGQTCQVRLTLLHTADIHSRLLPYDLLITQVDGDLGLGTTGDVRNVGGAARMAYVINREKARSERVLHISGGDVFEGAPIFNFFSGEPEMRVQAALGVDAMTLANHEFDRGANNVARQIQKWADFPVLAANYKFADPALPTSTPLGAFVQPFTVLNAGGLKVAVIGMANLSSLTSIFNTPNSFGITPLNSTDVVQFYVDMLRPMADLIVVDSHMGLEVDQRIITQTTGVDLWMGSHNHIVINPPEVVRDCSYDPQNPGYIWVLDPNYVSGDPVPNDADHPDPVGHPYQMHRTCSPRNVLLAHSGAFAKYVGRLDVVLSNTPAEATPTGNPADYDPANSFEVVSSKYQVFPITDQIPEDQVVKQLLEPYARQLSIMANLNVIAGFSPSGAKRTAPANGDSPLGNLIATANWLRLGVQTDFSMTNTTGIRQDLLPGPVTVDEMYDIFPFDNAITKMTLSGAEVYQMYDFIARRSASRGCVSQAQIAGSRVQINCTGCKRTFAVPTCLSDADCPAIETTGVCDLNTTLPDNGEHPCFMPACADNVYVGFTTNPCQSDNDCPDLQGKPQPGACSKQDIGQPGVCMTPVIPTNVYELATSDYLAGGGSGFRVLQRNTTQINTGIQQRDAVIDYIRAGKPCGWQDPNLPGNSPQGLWPCSTDADCASAPNLGSSYVCGCDGASTPKGSGSTLTCASGGGCDPSVGRCIRADCRDTVAQTRANLCADSQNSPACMAQVSPCDAASDVCQLVACVDDKLGALTDNRIQMIGR